MKDTGTLDTTVDEWREALADASEVSNIDGKTASELARELNCSETTMRLKLNGMVLTGRCRRLRGGRIASDGRLMSVNVYQLIPKEKKCP